MSTDRETEAEKRQSEKRLTSGVTEPASSPESEVMLTARLVARRRVHVVSDESAQQLAQGFLDLVESLGAGLAEEILAKAELKRKARAP